MKTLKTVSILVCSIALNGYSQGFFDLSFEQTVPTPDTSSPYAPYAIYASSGIPHWTANGFLSPNDILYNDLSLGATAVSLIGPQGGGGFAALAGNYSIVLYGGVQGPAQGASLSQTADVPANAASINFIAQGTMAPAGSQIGGPLIISMGGQNIPLVVLSTSANYTTYGGDVSAFAGQLATLAFTASQGVNNLWEIDGINFSPSPVPEPGVTSLVGIGLLILLKPIKNRLG